MASNKTLTELRNYVKDLTARDLQLLLALYGLQVAQDVTIEQLNDRPAGLMGRTMYAGSDLVDDAIDHVADLCDSENLSTIIDEFELADQFNINIVIQTVATAA
jgi:hypothetical protein